VSARLGRGAPFFFHAIDNSAKDLGIIFS